MQPLDKLGKYDVQGVIGRGAVGIVYAAFDPVLARPVAIKAIPLDLSDEHGRDKHARFKREAQAVARMHHPHIVAVYDYGEADRLAYIVMERLDGGSLKERIGRGDRLGLAEIRRIMRDLLDGLRHSHGHGVVHRDIKPANIVFDKDGNLKITDFGVARLDNADLTKEGSALGTPAYMSPEQVKGEAADARTDIYSVGVMLFEMLSGRRPFEGSAPSVMYKIINAPAPTLASLSLPALSGFEPIVARALAKSPDDRFASAADMARALEAAFSRQASHGKSPDGPATRPGGTRPEAASPRERIRSAAAAWPTTARSVGPRLTAAALACAIVAAAAWFLVPNGDRQAARHAAEAVHDFRTSPAPGSAPEPKPAPPSAETAKEANAPALPSADQAQTLRLTLDRELAAVPCSFLYGKVSSGGEVSIAGLTKLNETSQIEAAATIRRALSASAPVKSLTWHVAYIDGPYCPILSALRSLAADSGAFTWEARTWDARAGSHPRIEISPTPASLVVDRFMPNGKVAHIRSGATFSPDGARASIPPVIDTGAAAPGDLIVAIGSSQPVAPADRPRSDEAVTSYFADVRTAIDRARRSGATITGIIVFVNGSSS